MYVVFSVELNYVYDEMNLSNVKVEFLTSFSTQSDAAKCVRLLNKKNNTANIEYRYKKVKLPYEIKEGTCYE